MDINNEKMSKDNMSAEFKVAHDRIWLENEEGEMTAFIEFPEFEPGKVEVTHTVVDPALRGMGIAGRLTKMLAEKLIAEGRRAELTCSYAVKWFNDHREYEAALIDPQAEYEKACGPTENACRLPRHRG